MSCASSLAEPTSNRDLVLILRSTLIKARSLFSVDFCWVKGHAEIGGNTRVDQLSKFFASAVPSCLGSDYVTRAKKIHLDDFTLRHVREKKKVAFFFLDGRE